jgi:predicted alpha/beta-fold hydrolase
MADGRTISAGTCNWGTTEDFLPPRWLRNPHLQSIVPSLPLWSPRVFFGCEVPETSRREIIDCGGGVRLLGFRAIPYVRPRDGVRRMAILLHGWHGSADSADIVSLAQLLFERGYEVLRLNLRDHGDTQALNIGLFHSCRLGEVVGAVRTLQHQHPRRELSLVGFSLGGNFGMRIGARARAEGLDLAHIVAVCPVAILSMRCREPTAGHSLPSLLHPANGAAAEGQERGRRARYDFRDMLRMSA